MARTGEHLVTVHEPPCGEAPDRLGRLGSGVSCRTPPVLGAATAGNAHFS